jgi:hypothetical protein
MGRVAIEQGRFLLGHKYLCEGNEGTACSPKVVIECASVRGGCPAWGVNLPGW